jgi:hypothetical protein
MNARIGRAVGPFILGFLFVMVDAACKSTGGGEGRTPTGEVTATFQWQQSDPASGTLKATVVGPDGTQEMYQGKYFQITGESRIEGLGLVWDAWDPTWVGWRYWGPVPTVAFIKHYTGQVVANLEGPNAQRMRCHFKLLRPSMGMKGGGEGECQLPMGRTIKAEFPAS